MPFHFLNEEGDVDPILFSGRDGSSFGIEPPKTGPGGTVFSPPTPLVTPQIAETGGINATTPQTNINAEDLLRDDATGVPGPVVPSFGTPVTGEEVPFTIDPNQFTPEILELIRSSIPQAEAPGVKRTRVGLDPQFQQLLQQLMGQMGEGGIQGEFQNTLLQSVLGGLENPTLFGGDLLERARVQGERALDERFSPLYDNLKADLARRGLDFSSVAGSRFNDLGTERLRSSENLITNLLLEQARTGGADRSRAIGDALGFGGLLESSAGRRFSEGASLLGVGERMGTAQAGLDAQLAALRANLQSRTSETNIGSAIAGLGMGFNESFRRREEGRGERDFLEQLRTQARDQAIQELLISESLGSTRQSEQDRLLQLAFGTTAGGPTADFGGVAGQQGQITDRATSDLTNLATLPFMFGGGAGAAATGRRRGF